MESEKRSFRPSIERSTSGRLGWSDGSDGRLPSDSARPRLARTRARVDSREALDYRARERANDPPSEARGRPTAQRDCDLRQRSS